MIHPLRRDITGRVDGCTLTFTVDETEPRYFIVEIDDLPLLGIVLDPPEAQTLCSEDTDVVDAGEILRRLTAGEDATNAFMQAIAMAMQAGKALYVPSGCYEVETLHLQQVKGLLIYLAPGCLIRVRPSLHGESAHVHGLWLDACEDVGILGRSCIDHQGYEHQALGGNNYQHGLLSYFVPNALCPFLTQSPLNITNCRNITVDGLTVRNSRNFCVNVRHSDDIHLLRMKLLTPAACTPGYGDGFQVNSCRDVLIENSFCISNDDCFTAGHYFYSIDDRSTERITVRGLLGWNARANGLRLGFHTH